MPAIQKPTEEATIAAMFDRIAPRYDLLNRLLSARQDQRWRRALVAKVPVRPGGLFVDVATGTGDVILAVAHARTEYRAMVGVDISQEMLNLAAAKAGREAPAQPLEFKKMSAEALALNDASVDAMSISFGLRNVVHKDQALREFCRVLKPGGTLLILEFFLPESGLLSWLFQLYFHHILPFIGGLISDKKAYTYLPQSVGSFYRPDALAEALLASGLRVVSQTNFLFGATRLVEASKIAP